MFFSIVGEVTIWITFFIFMWKREMSIKSTLKQIDILIQQHTILKNRLEHTIDKVHDELKKCTRRMSDPNVHYTNKPDQEKPKKYQDNLKKFLADIEYNNFANPYRRYSIANIRNVGDIY